MIVPHDRESNCRNEFSTFQALLNASAWFWNMSWAAFEIWAAETLAAWGMITISLTLSSFFAKIVSQRLYRHQNQKNMMSPLLKHYLHNFRLCLDHSMGLRVPSESFIGNYCWWLCVSRMCHELLSGAAATVFSFHDEKTGRLLAIWLLISTQWASNTRNVLIGSRFCNKAFISIPMFQRHTVQELAVCSQSRDGPSLDLRQPLQWSWLCRKCIYRFICILQWMLVNHHFTIPHGEPFGSIWTFEVVWSNNALVLSRNHKLLLNQQRQTIFFAFSGFPYLYLLVLTEMRLSKVILWHVDFSGFKFHCRSRVALFSTVSSAMTVLFMHTWMELASFVRASSSSSFLENF